MEIIATIGLDIAKTSFAVHCAAASGREVKKAELKRARVLPFFAAIAPCAVGIEACGSAHHWAREIGKQGHAVKLIPAGRVKTFVLRSARMTPPMPAPSRRRWPIPRRAAWR